MVYSVFVSRLMQYSVCLLFLGFSFATQSKEIRFNIGVKGYPPYTITNQNLEVSGILVDILEKVAQEKGYDVRYFEIPRKRVDMMLEQGQLDVTPRAIEWTSEPENFIFSDPIISIRDVLFSPSSKPLQFDQIEDLIGTRLRTHVGYTYQGLDKYFENGLVYRHDDEFEEQMLSNLIAAQGRFDAAIVDELVGYWLIKNNNWDGQLVASKNALASVDFRLMFNKQFSQFVSDFNRKLRHLKETNKLQNIIDKYTKGKNH